MAITNLNIRVTKEIKEKSEAVFSELGINMTTAVNIFLRAVIRENGIPFTLLLNQEDNSINQTEKENLSC